MSKIASLLRLKTMRAQMMTIIIAAILLVVLMGHWARELTDNYLGTVDPDEFYQRAGAVALLVQQAPKEDHEAILNASRRAGIPFELVESETFTSRTSPEVTRGWLSFLVRKLFPADDLPPLQSEEVLFDGRLALAFHLRLGDVLVFTGLPDTLITTDFIGPLTYYLMSFGILLLFFSVYAVYTVIGPFSQITSVLRNSRVDEAGPLLEEKGSSEMRELTRALNEMRSRIRDLLEKRTRMLRGVSHDLRTPLTRVRLRIERLSDSRMRPVLADLDHINSLIQETLEFVSDRSRSEAMQRTDIASLLQTICDEYSDMGHSVTFEGPDHLIGLCKPTALIRAVTNLCDNGTKFANHVSVTLSIESSKIVIRVVDDGPGIPAEMHELVLEPFFKIDDARTSEGDQLGFGLGLSIVADIVKAHEGTLAFEQSTSRGLAVRIELPAA